MTFTTRPSGFAGGFRVIAGLLAFFIPVSIASAGVLSVLEDMFARGKGAFSRVTTSQNVPLLLAVGGPDPDVDEEHELPIEDGHALLADAGPVGTLSDLDESSSRGMISTYTVREGDSLSEIANMFGVSMNTILWANNLSRSTPLRVGQELVILPVSGVSHTVKKGDTLASIAKKYKASVEDILHFNAIDEDAPLEVGTVIIVPNGEIPAPPSAPRTTSVLRGASGPAIEGYYMRPLLGGRKTQGLHGYNGIDFGAPRGTPVYASAAGEVIVARNSGYNGGYGKYVVVGHDNGTQTLYGHLNTAFVSVGDRVAQGQILGEVGNTGRSTGPHLHFEVRGARNPF